MLNDGIKRLTTESWDQPDPVMHQFVHVSPDGDTLVEVSGDDWVRAVQASTLSDLVPVEVSRLFAVAQGALVYGYFFYPLFALGAEQLARVGEAAVRHACLAHDIPIANERWDRSLGVLLIDLRKKQVLTDDEKEWWTSLQKLRNEVSHPKDQMVLTPGVAIDTLHAVAAAINRLFTDEP